MSEHKYRVTLYKVTCLTLFISCLLLLTVLLPYAVGVVLVGEMDSVNVLVVERAEATCRPRLPLQASAWRPDIGSEIYSKSSQIFIISPDLNYDEVSSIIVIYLIIYILRSTYAISEKQPTCNALISHRLLKASSEGVDVSNMKVSVAVSSSSMSPSSMYTVRKTWRHLYNCN